MEFSMVRWLLTVVLSTLFMFSSPLRAASSPVFMSGTLELTPHADPGPGNEAWTFTYTEPGLATTIVGIIIKPFGTGPFPGVVASHGKGGDAFGFGMEKGKDWFAPAGYITIAVNYTHAGSVYCKDASEQCAGSAENVTRGNRAYNLLRSQNLINLIGDVVNRDVIALYGNSLGALTTLELAQDLGSKITAVAVSAGGIYAEGVFAYMTPSGVAGVANIFSPVLHLHGRLDNVIPATAHDTMANALDIYDKPHQQVWFPNGGHNIARAASTENQVRDFVLSWFSVINTKSNPRISSLSRSSASVGGTLAIAGTNFGTNVNANSAVKIGAVTAEIVSWTNTRITVTVPAGAVSSWVQVVVPVGPITDPSIEQPVYGGIRSNRVPVTII